MKVVIVGASGALGSRLADLLVARGDEVVRASRATGVDAYAGTGLAEAFAGADAVVDSLSLQTLKAEEAIDFFESTATNIARAAAQAGVAHVIVVSIVNAGDPAVNAKFGYYQGKAAQEAAYRKVLGPDILTVFASVQWFELAEQMMGSMSFGPVAAVPRMQCAPAAVSDVAVALADVVTAGPQDKATVEIAGPDRMDLVDVAKALAAQTGTPRWVVGVPVGGRAIRHGGLVPAAPDVVTTTTLGGWLAGRERAQVGENR
ncbi:SDR family oxidoreductase [Gordonia sp. 'Campus']|uniref:SDR family oxidoreductase n=1 Tax=Gordonia sp. 'Campus' TaxID=2915824 RepID=UPI001EE3CC13|nr:SDR family oxidoreductase [Gordonia sp. 'Campus']